MPTLIVENGTIVADANTYVTVDQVTAYQDQRVDSSAAWLQVDAGDQIRMVILAWDYLRNEARYSYRGTRISIIQKGSWPRNDAAEYRGPSIPNNVIPLRMQDAQCDLAMRLAIAFVAAATNDSLVTALQPDLDHGGRVESERVDVVAQTFFKDAAVETVLQTVNGLLKPILYEILTQIEPFVALPRDAPAFRPGEYSYRQGGALPSPGRDGGDAIFIP